jgi:3-phosphoshikimate 1-carboxyvinyltransferase
MSFAVAGLRTEGVVIRHPEVVAKSFPDFWRVFNQL